MDSSLRQSGNLQTKDQTQESISNEALKLLRLDFALYCRTLRLNLGLSQRKFAELMGVKNAKGKVTISRWESGSHVPQDRYLLKFMELQKKFDIRKVG